MHLNHEMLGIEMKRPYPLCIFYQTPSPRKRLINKEERKEMIRALNDRRCSKINL